MDKLGEIEIRVVGNSGNEELKPNNYDIKHIAVILQNVEDLLHPNNKKERPLITYDLKEGSVRHIFKTTVQTVIGFSALLTQVEVNNSVDFLEVKTAKALESIQNLSRQKNYEFQIKTSLSNSCELNITPKTNFVRTEKFWAEAEFYFYGVIKDAGGKSKANIHIDTKDYGYLSIETGEEFLSNQEENLLYKEYGIRTTGKQNIETGEIDTKSLKLIELIDYSPRFDKSYLDSLIIKAKGNINKINPNEWLSDLRGGYEA